MSYPPQLDYFCSRLEGLSVGLFRLEPQGAASGLSAGQIVRFTLPSNALVDLRSFCLRFNCETTPAASVKVAYRLPNRIESIISKVSVSIGGVQVSSGTSFYNTLVHAKACIDGWADDAGKNHPEMIQSLAVNNYVTGQALTNNETSNGLVAPFSIDKWAGFLGECEPRVLDSGLCGDIVVQLTLEQPQNCITCSNESTADANFILCAGANAAATYEVSNLYATIRCYSLPSGVYDNLLAEQMASAGSLEVGFKNYYSFRDSTQSVLRFQVASQSINRIFVAAHAENGTNIPADARFPHLVPGYGQETAGANINKNLNLGKIKYIHKYSQFSEPPSATAPGSDWTINGAKFPQYKMSSEDALQITRLSGDKGDMAMADTGLVEWKDSQYVVALKLTMDTPNSRFIQGLDSRSVAVAGYYNLYDLNAARVFTLFVECGSSLLISSGRQIAVVM